MVPTGIPLLRRAFSDGRVWCTHWSALHAEDLVPERVNFEGHFERPISGGGQAKDLGTRVLDQLMEKGSKRWSKKWSKSGQNGPSGQDPESWRFWVVLGLGSSGGFRYSRCFLIVLVIKWKNGFLRVVHLGG